MSTIPDTLILWLYTNAPAAWLAAIVATITLIYILLTRKKPKKIIVRDIYESSLVRIWPSVKKKISLTFEGKTIDTLGQVDLEIFNEGSEVIKNPTFMIVFPKTSRVLDVLLRPQDGKPTREIKNNNVTISIDYLNPMREHNHVLFVSFLVDGATAPIKAEGTGEGWSMRHVPLLTEKQFKRGLYIFIGCFTTVFIIISVYYQYYIKEHFNININEMSYKAFVASLPFLLPSFIGVGLFLRWILKSAGLTKSPMSIFEHDDKGT